MRLNLRSCKECEKDAAESREEINPFGPLERKEIASDNPDHYLKQGNRYGYPYGEQCRHKRQPHPESCLKPLVFQNTSSNHSPIAKWGQRVVQNNFCNTLSLTLLHQWGGNPEQISRIFAEKQKTPTKTSEVSVGVIISGYTERLKANPIADCVYYTEPELLLSII